MQNSIYRELTAFLSIRLLKRRQIKGSEPSATATAHILLQVVARSRWSDVDQLLDQVQKVGCRLVIAQPKEVAIPNIVRRVLGLIRDEAEENRNEVPSETSEGGFHDHQSNPHAGGLNEGDGDFISGPPRLNRVPTLTPIGSISAPKSLFQLLSAPAMDDVSGAGHLQKLSGASTPTRSGPAQSAAMHALKSEVIDGIEEIKDEISQVDDQIAGFADVQIHPGDYVLVHQPSSTTERFLLRAAARRKFTVFIVAGPQPTPGEVPYASLKKRLASSGVTAINIMNGGVMAYMPRVNKVVLGARAVLADGSVMADGGASVIARAAKEQGNTVIVLSGVYKISPDHLIDEEALVERGNPSNFVSYGDGAIVNGVDVRSALTELIPQDLIDTYITNL
jgi:translation initiation factor eIF-2B subunit beta